MTTNLKNISRQALWHNNPALVQLLGLCPLLAVSSSVVNALGLALATTMVLVFSNLMVSLIRHQITDAIRLPVFVLIIAGFVTCVELLLQAFAYPLYLSIGIFIPLIVTNCAILGRAVSFAAKNPPLISAFDGLMTGLGFGLVLLALGAIRELIGTGAVFANMELLLPFAGNWELTVLPGYPGFLLALLPPGAFLLMGLLLAIKNLISSARPQSEQATEAAVQSINNN
ncbi:MAG: electron transport complex subunit RsxE [SAR86 cluster bacterium]|uniref:Ion-translocating oxidoreductase complex subunit E n=1 Tax=SAR86 cluster bacterium TaxID=2030880 RepID=A0A2A5CAS3_9GAMM|nr:electron transport complex subunit E [Gammaproteobacteria bacterium AH-315-E17]PCJ40863.1 MAG: electron transport complex subunit RsxE [SAR86 cluster bacterium]